MVGQEQKTPFQLDLYSKSQLPSAASRDNAPFINLVSLQSAVEKQREDNTPIL